MLSILILTKNEEQDLPHCLASVAWSDDIHVYDSFSTDRTVEIAKTAGATITQRTFDDWASHQNWGLNNIKFKHSWVLYIDADERVTESLAFNIEAAIRNPKKAIAFRIRRRDFYKGTWLRHVQTSPYYIRVFKPEYIKYERLVNPITIPSGPVGEITGFLDHFPFSKGISHWIARHNNYSTLEALQIVNDQRGSKNFSIVQAFFCRDFNERRAHQKEIFYRLPARPIVKFLLLYLLKRGILDGRAGFSYAILQSIYEYFITLKVDEIGRKDKL